MASLMMRGRSYALVVVVALACVATLSLLVASSASATTTLHFFSKQVTSTLTGVSGKPLAGNATPVVGDRFDNTDLDYVGNHEHHAKTWTASDDLVCTFTSITGMSGTATCDGQIAIGGSMLLAENVKLRFSNAPSQVLPLTGGTGKFRGVHGHVVATDIGHSNNSDLTITLTG